MIMKYFLIQMMKSDRNISFVIEIYLPVKIKEPGFLESDSTHIRHLKRKREKNCFEKQNKRRQKLTVQLKTIRTKSKHTQ